MRCGPLTTFFPRMIHHLKLIQLKAGLPVDRVEEMMVESRIRILKIQILYQFYLLSHLSYFSILHLLL